MLRDFHAFMRTGAMRLADAERELLEEGELEVDPESPFNVDDLRATDDVVRPRVAVLLRKGTRKIVNEAEMMAGLRAAFPFAEVRSKRDVCVREKTERWQPAVFWIANRRHAFYTPSSADAQQHNDDWCAWRGINQSQ